MGLFKTITNVALPGASVISKLVTGKSLGSHLEGMMGGNGAEQFNPDFTRTLEDIQKVRELRDKPITDIRESTKLQLNGLADSRDLSLGDLAKTGQGRFSSIASQAALTGGLSGGAVARIGRAQVKQGMNEAQRLLSDYAGRETGIRASDFAAQEALKNQALFGSPQLSMGMDSINAQVAAANMQARAAADAQRAGRFGQIGSLIGTGAGFALGGPMGGMIGGSIGGSLGGFLA